MTLPIKVLENTSGFSTIEFTRAGFQTAELLASGISIGELQAVEIDAATLKGAGSSSPIQES